MDTRNPGTPLDLEAVRRARVNRTAADRRAATLAATRAGNADWLLRAVAMIDLTTLSDDDTEGRVRRLCDKALRPLRSELLVALGAEGVGVTAAAVCVYDRFVPMALAALGGRLPVATVSAGFPAGLSPLATRVAEIEASVKAGADEIDVVIVRGLAQEGRWEALYDEITAFRRACGDRCMKVILGVGELGALDNVRRAATVAMMAGADFVKTSTGKEKVKATLSAGLAMAAAIRDYHRDTGHGVGLKAAGGIATAREALSWLALVREELGEAWMHPGLFRIGASSLLADIERQLEQVGRSACGR
ncbi:MAG: deoxyribose-phosphate aldolase [Gemmatimonadetes bacterium]|nr:deoxyribose-phosphate aldolase [Gemmatimonadota bacterium]